MNKIESTPSANDNLVYPTIVSSLALPGLDLPEGTEPPQGAAFPKHTEARIELLKDANLVRWRHSLSTAAASLREARADVNKASRKVRGLRKAVVELGAPNTIRLWVLLLAALAGLGCEYALSARLIGPCFGFEPDSFWSLCLGAVPVICTIAMKVPAGWVVGKLRGRGGPAGNTRKIVVFAVELALVAGMMWANYDLIRSLAPLREQVGAVIESAAHEDAGTDGSDAAIDPGVEARVVLLLSVVAVLDSLVLCLVVDIDAKRAFRYRNLTRELDDSRAEGAEALARYRSARREFAHQKYVWDGREARAAAIAKAMAAREDCLRVARALTATEWVDAMMDPRNVPSLRLN